MAHRSDDSELLRSVGSSVLDEDISEKNIFPVNDVSGGDDNGSRDNNGCSGGGGGSVVRDEGNVDNPPIADRTEEDGDLPQCKIKRNYSCNLCSFFSQNPRSFLYHSRDVHFDKIKIFECPHCLYASKHSQKLQRHINMIHVAEKNKKKPIRLDKRRGFRIIKPKPPDPSLNIPTEEVSQTEIEEIVLKSEIGLGGELNEAIDGEFQCSLCSFKNKNEKLMRRHEKMVHLKKRFLRCAKCSYVTHVKARFTKHVKYHSMPMIKCNLCDFRTPYKWNLDRHYKNHCGTGAFQCSKCNFRADIKQSLTVHEMNHHIPPVGQGALTARRKNKVGASEVSALESDNIDKDELELLRLEREDIEPDTSQGEKVTEDIKKEGINLRNVKPPYCNKREAANHNHLRTDFIHPDDIVPRYGQIYVKNLKCKFCSYKAVFSHEIWRHEKRIHGYIRPENKKSVPKRPPPKLIPIQNKSSGSSPCSSPILKIPSIRNKAGATPTDSSSLDKPVNEKEFNEMCKKSCLTSSLKDFVSLIGDEEGLKTIPDSSRDDIQAGSAWTQESSDESETKGTDLFKQKQTDLLKKKNASFFDKLKEKLMTSSNDEQSLYCGTCSHESKCLSEAVAHQKRHSNTNNKNELDAHSENDMVFSGGELSSTRCQHCRQRCKTSTDLINHLKTCKAFEAAQDTQSNFESIKIKEENEVEDEEKIEKDESSMQNRVFVWNDLHQNYEEEEEEEEEEEKEKESMETDLPSNENFSMATTPGYGTVTNKGSDNTESGTFVMEMDPRLNLTVKKVFKCPHCSFWASTASRFHVHIVGHLNKKPFECSLCMYRSNWRWDITKHIRLKSARDPSHLEAKVNMTDETGRRNYSKYNKYLTMMKVQEPTAESSGTGRRTKPSEATQGNVAEKDIIIPLPAPPRLTRAPTPGVSHQVPQDLPLAPPPLKAAHQISPQARCTKGIKKTLWKCKKCDFRDSKKENVLEHVMTHLESKDQCRGKSVVHSVTNDAENGFQNRNVTGGSPLKPSQPGGSPSVKGNAGVVGSGITKSQGKTPTYKCGHCHQISKWKHVIQRHCLLKHNGNAAIEISWNNEQKIHSNDVTESAVSVEHLEDSIEIISCDICPFTTDTAGDLTAHKLNHVDRPGSIFKCLYCPFFVPSKTAVLEHMELHGIQPKNELTSLKVDNLDPSEEFLTQSSEDAGDGLKRYKCSKCPYLSNNKTQFLYHKQFHRPLDLGFKCMYCSYRVSRRHLLHQHLRVHHSQKNISASQEKTSLESSETVSLNELNTIDMPEIPLVWVFKRGNFVKMFKCRWCPHVNMRKINIQEHEKMHRSHESLKDDSNQTHPPLKLHCSVCSYTCNNPGVLASHVKVHQGFYGEIRCLVDPTRSDAEQIEELQSGIPIVEPEVLIIVDPDGDLKELKEVEKTEKEEVLSSQPENAYNHSTNKNSTENTEEDNKKILSFCNRCPARFFYKKELRIHSKFHLIHLPFRCLYCSYTARQRPHLLAHYKVHSQEYQDKTKGLVENYIVSPENPQQKTIVMTRESYVMEGPVWVVESPGGLEKKGDENHAKSVAKYFCHRCPAKFLKSVGLQYHLTLHGGSHKHKCKYCDYSVKMYGNLIRHQLVHQNDVNEKAPKGMKFSYSFPVTEGDLYSQDDSDGICGNDKELLRKKRRKKDHFKSLALGSSDFIYPTYVKPKKVKEKRYRCQKCPSAFDKRDQYRIHISLHGSKQKYMCGKCNYSVKYYANYVQHVKKHQSHEETLRTRTSVMSEIIENQRNNLTDGENLYELTLLEQQTLLLQKRKKMFDGRDSYGCEYCPYASSRKDVVDNHMKRHYRVSGIKSIFECTYCDYSATQGNFLREHNRFHFNVAFRYRAEAFLKCEKMELWCWEDKPKEDESKVLIFQDKGEDVEGRFFPKTEIFNEDENNFKIYVNPETGEPIEKEASADHANECTSFEIYNEEFPIHCEDLIEMVREPEIEDTVQKQKPKVKRWRGKNWKCKKCPHAFGKRDQFLRHTALHGSKQRHNCDICDYSVKFYTNYVQHMRMHQRHEPNRTILVKRNFQRSEENETTKKDNVSLTSKRAHEEAEESNSCLSQENKTNELHEIAFGTNIEDSSDQEELKLKVEDVRTSIEDF